MEESRDAGRPIRVLESVTDLLDGEPAFDFEQRTYTYGDVLRAATLRGEHSSAADADPVSGTEDPAEIRAGVIALRRAHGLLSAQDYHAWLAERGLDSDAVDAHVRGTAPVTAAQLRGELILSGRLRAWAQWLADCVAVTAANTIDAELTGTARLAALIAAEASFRAELLSDTALDRVIADHRLEWQRLIWSELALETEGAAREAALWIRTDGLALADVAGLAHSEIVARRSLYCEVPTGVSPLLAATPGEMVGPLADGDAGWCVATLTARSTASPEDPELRRRAEEELVKQAMERYRAGRIRWHVEL